jgi:ubiquinone/menaquinone biosynthesis C-methylase UbiE
MNLHERDATVEELLDASEVDPLVLEQSLSDLRRLEFVLGWTNLAVADVARIVAQQQLHTFSVLDVATGAANVPIALARWARCRKLQIEITATDISEQVLAVARVGCAGFPEIRLEQQNALALTYEPQSFDLVLCQGALHHFAPDEAQVLLRELARVARRAVIVTDLQRSLPLYLVARLLMNTLILHPVTRHDGLASIRRAYIPSEIRALADQADLHSATIRTTFPFFRQVLVWQR